MPWPDIEIELVAYLKTALGVRVLTDLPAALDDILPVVQIARVGGTDDGFRLDRALVDVDVFASTRGAASELSALLRHALVTSLPGRVSAQAVFGRVSTVAAPAQRPYENTRLRRFGATFEIHFHPVV